MAEQLKKSIANLLKKNPRGLTIVQLAKLTKFSTTTVSKALAKLEGEDKIDIVRAGSAKMHYWRKKKW